MPFEIVHNDITKMQVDAIVNSANPNPVIGSGVDAGIHIAAGINLIEARKEIGRIESGCAEITPAFELPAKYVIHTVGPVWQGGGQNEEKILAGCYKNSLNLAVKYKCGSIAFPLISSGNYGFPKQRALHIAVEEIGKFALENDMRIYLTVFDKESYSLSEKLLSSVKSYIDENFIKEKIAEEYSFNVSISRFRAAESFNSVSKLPPQKDGLDKMLKNMDESFSETLLKLIDKTGKKDSEIYKKANIDRKLFSKIRSNRNYKPSKTTALAFAFALEMSLEQTQDFIRRAGYALSRSSKSDVIVEYFLVNKNYNIFEVNEVLFEFDQPLLGNC